MTDKKISELTEVTSPAGTDVLPIVSGGDTKKITVDNLLAASAPPLASVLASGSDVNDLDIIGTDGAGTGTLRLNETEAQLRREAIGAQSLVTAYTDGVSLEYSSNSASFRGLYMDEDGFWILDANASFGTAGQVLTADGTGTSAWTDGGTAITDGDISVAVDQTAGLDTNGAAIVTLSDGATTPTLMLEYSGTLGPGLLVRPGSTQNALTLFVGDPTFGAGTSYANIQAIADNGVFTTPQLYLSAYDDATTRTASASLNDGEVELDATRSVIIDTAAVLLRNLPTADPGVAGQVYSDGAPSAGVPKVLKISGG